MIYRQNMSLKRLAKTMNDKLEYFHDPPLLSNTELMIAIIREVQKVPVAEARAIGVLNLSII